MFCIEFIKIKNISRDRESEVFMVKCAESECRLIAWTECSLKVKCDDLTAFGSLPLCLAKHFISCWEPPPSSEKDLSCRRLGFWPVPLWCWDPDPEPNCDWFPGWLVGLPWQRTVWTVYNLRFSHLAKWEYNSWPRLPPWGEWEGALKIK